ncbi:MAG TPA: NADH-quinone oxidoreductase subunit N [Dissulfurispiraceae bacterium]|nr:NADH-quinone oxidoreductase subunit N [Dissulfurispiraceae bacterium]
MNIPFPDVTPVIPEIIMATVASLLLLAELVFANKKPLGYTGVVVSAIVIYLLPLCKGEAFGGMFISDDFSVYFKMIFLISLILTILISLKYLQIEHADFGEYYSLLLFSTTGMMIMASARDFILVFLGIELMSLSLYILCGVKKHDPRSSEAAMKYFLLGAFSSALLLYGISMVYGLTTTTDIYGIASYLRQTPPTLPLMLSMILIIVAFSFKISAVPFHMWAPDVYEGAPTSVTAFMSTAPKAAAFAVLGRIFFTAYQTFEPYWTTILLVISVLTMAVGTIMAIVQTNIKRMLAFSSIAHAGYILIALIAGTNEAMNAMKVYLMIYTFMNLGAFGIVILLEKGENISDYNGLSKSHPFTAALMLVFMFSLAGIPPTAGFIGKFYIFMAAINAGYTWLVIIAVVFSAVSAYFYLRIIMNMYMKPMSETVGTTPSLGLAAALFISAIMMFAIGLVPSIVLF